MSKTHKEMIIFVLEIIALLCCIIGFVRQEPRGFFGLAVIPLWIVAVIEAHDKLSKK